MKSEEFLLKQEFLKVVLKQVLDDAILQYKRLFNMRNLKNMIELLNSNINAGTFSNY